MAVNLDAKDIANTIKSVPYKSVCAVVIAVTGMLVFLPPTFIDFLGLSGICSTYRPYLGILWIISLCIVVVGSFYEWLHRRMWRASFKGERAKKKLDALSSVAKCIVRTMYESDKQTMTLSIADANVCYLQNAFVIQSATMSVEGGYFDFYLQPWVVTYLDKNPAYLAQFPKMAADKEAFR